MIFYDCLARHVYAKLFRIAPHPMLFEEDFLIFDSGRLITDVRICILFSNFETNSNSPLLRGFITMFSISKFTIFYLLNFFCAAFA